MNYSDRQNGDLRPRDVLVIGAGPAGLSCALELQRCGIDVLVIEKGCVANSLVRFPTYMRFFTSPEGIEVGGIPMVSLEDRPGRTEAVKYYHRVARQAGLDIRQYENVIQATSEEDLFAVRTSRGEYRARRIVIATGYCDQPVQLGVRGEDHTKVTHYYREPHACFDQHVAVIGGRNSAGAAALELHGAGARVTFIYRKPSLTSAMKPWLRHDLEERIKSGAIRGLFDSEVVEIGIETITVRTPHGLETLPNAFVFAMTGYRPDLAFLAESGVEIDSETGRPRLHPETCETSRKGVYLAGVVVAGLNTNELNISHAREHATRIRDSIRQSFG